MVEELLRMPVDTAPNLNSKLYRCRQKRRFIMLIGNKDLTSLILRMNSSIRALYFYRSTVYRDGPSLMKGRLNSHIMRVQQVCASVTAQAIYTYCSVLQAD